MLKLENENDKIFDKIIVRIVGFHVRICLLCTIYSYFRNTGLAELFSRVGLEGKSTTHTYCAALFRILQSYFLF